MILLNYPKYVGGKFIANCLALSKHCVVQNLEIAKQDLTYTTFDADYYQFKLNSVLKTLPTRANMNGWGGYEFGCDQLYGVNETFYKENTVEHVRGFAHALDIIKRLEYADKESCLIAHDYPTLIKYREIYPQAQLIEFSNFEEFRVTALKLKDPDPDNFNSAEYESSATVYNSMRDSYKFNSYVIDVDRTFFPWNAFEPMMQGLYEYVGFDDFNSDLVRSFWNQYINLHR